jgi:L-amino acid N-acyltransferase YncA
MTGADCDIGPATRDDIAGILDLQDRNQIARGGALSVALSWEWFEASLADMPIVVARRGGKVVGYAVSSSLAANAKVPQVQAALRVYRPAPDAYIYGPICVDESERGCGLGPRLFAALTARLAGREAVTFIRSDNAPSRGVHAKMGLREVAETVHDGIPIVVLTYQG